MRVLKVGNGFVSSHLPYDFIPERLTPSNIGEILDRWCPEVLINCIGKTGSPNIDWCEINKEETYLANTIIPQLLAYQCFKRNIHFIHIGSGCIFYGFKAGGWKENDITFPKSYYSRTKLATDLTIGDLKNVCVLRIRMPISSLNHSRNLITKLKGYSKIIDIPNSVTFLDDLVRCVKWVIEEQKVGLYHTTNPELLTAAQIMQEYQKYHPEHKFEIISEEELNQITTAKRSNCSLNCDKLEAAGFKMTNSRLALENCMKNYCKGII